MAAAASEWTKIEGGDWLSYLGLKGSKHSAPLIHRYTRFSPRRSPRRSPVRVRSPVRMRSPLGQPRRSPVRVRSPVRSQSWKNLVDASPVRGVPIHNMTNYPFIQHNLGNFPVIRKGNMQEYMNENYPSPLPPTPQSRRSLPASPLSGRASATNSPQPYVPLPDYMQNRLDMLDQGQFIARQGNMQQYMNENYPSPLPPTPQSRRSLPASPLSNRSSATNSPQPYVPLPDYPSPLPPTPQSRRSLPASPLSGRSRATSSPQPYVPLPGLSPLSQGEEALRFFQRGKNIMEGRNRSSPRVHHA